mmetsp:Transcript_64000/g.125963  ORF Transcript_64000/g.125963 Transcript_64000/m.125963 type:complete len:285 (-) Transcript_64000:375-1229(-)
MTRTRMVPPRLRAAGATLQQALGSLRRSTMARLPGRLSKSLRFGSLAGLRRIRAGMVHVRKREVQLRRNPLPHLCDVAPERLVGFVVASFVRRRRRHLRLRRGQELVRRWCHCANRLLAFIVLFVFNPILALVLRVILAIELNVVLAMFFVVIFAVVFAAILGPVLAFVLASIVVLLVLTLLFILILVGRQPRFGKTRPRLGGVDSLLRSPFRNFVLLIRIRIHDLLLRCIRWRLCQLRFDILAIIAARHRNRITIFKFRNGFGCSFPVTVLFVIRACLLLLGI